MNPADIKAVANREPFRAFTVRLSNGSEYEFSTRSDLGAPSDFHMIFYFDQDSATRIDVEHITEITE